jgi:hypothetical protein
MEDVTPQGHVYDGGVSARVASLRARVAAAGRDRTGAEYARQQSEQRVSEISAVLKQEFGVETPEQARALVGDLDRQVASEVEKIEQALGP